jgi:hypothetical protein
MATEAQQASASAAQSGSEHDVASTPSSPKQKLSDSKPTVHSNHEATHTEDDPPATDERPKANPVPDDDASSAHNPRHPESSCTKSRQSTASGSTDTVDPVIAHEAAARAADVDLPNAEGDDAPQPGTAETSMFEDLADEEVSLARGASPPEDVVTDREASAVEKEQLTNGFTETQIIQLGELGYTREDLLTINVEERAQALKSLDETLEQMMAHVKLDKPHGEKDIASKEPRLSAEEADQLKKLREAQTLKENLGEAFVPEPSPTDHPHEPPFEFFYSDSEESEDSGDEGVGDSGDEEVEAEGSDDEDDDDNGEANSSSHSDAGSDEDTESDGRSKKLGHEKADRD